MELRRWLRPLEISLEAAPAKPMREVPVELIGHRGADWTKLSVVDQAESLTNPVFLLVEPGRSTEIDVSTGQLRSKLKSLGRAPDHLALDPGFAAALPKARAAVYRKIEEFFNLRLHDYGVKIGPAKEVN
jgi:hypothetical protein